MENNDIKIHSGFLFETNITVTDSAGNPVDLSPYEIKIDFYDNFGNVIYQASESTGEITVLNNVITLKIPDHDTLLYIDDGYYVLYGVDSSGMKTFILQGNVSVVKYDKVNIDYLIPYVRMKIGDMNGERYEDDWIRTALILAIKESQRYLNNKYLIDSDNSVYRNPIYYAEDPYDIIDARDEPIIVLLAAIIILEGSLENSAWNAMSWRDNEISFSNLEQFRTRSEILRTLIDELHSLVLPPVKRLGKVSKVSMPGYFGNPLENKTNY